VCGEVAEKGGEVAKGGEVVAEGLQAWWCFCNCVATSLLWSILIYVVFVSSLRSRV
jgi:hypothetical protein